MQRVGNQVIDDKTRFTVITNQLLRIEYSQSGEFEDQPTQAVQHRDFGQPDFEVWQAEHGHHLEIVTDGFHLYYEGGELSAGSLFIDAANNYGTHYSRWYSGEPLQKNLKGTARTLDKADGAIPLEDGLMSKDGFSVLDDSASFIQNNEDFRPRSHPEIDQYYFAYGRDFRATLKAYYQLTGFPPVVPRFALGNWWSRYYPYSQDEYLALMAKFDQKQIPIAVSVFDMNWHTTDIPKKYGSGWTGYTWNHQLFPDPQAMMSKLHAQGRKVTLNVHPASGIRPSEEQYPAVAKALGLDTAKEQPALFDLQNPAFKQAYFELVHHKLEQQGVDFWWLDWQQGGQRGTKLDPLWLLNVDHYLDNQAQHPGAGLILSRYAGPGSHRYPIGFSGDTVASWKSLAFQPYFTATAANIGYTWWSHDIGGHMLGTYNSELSLRWLQLGVFSPILRLHSSNNIFMGKEPWNYPSDVGQAMTEFLRLRTKMVPYLDSANAATAKQGLPLVQPMYYGYPDSKQAYNYPNQFLFGDSMLVAPIVTPADAVTNQGSVKVWLPSGTWYDFLTGQKYQGERTFKAYRDKAHYPVFVKAGGIVPLNADYMQPLAKLPAKLTVEIYAGVNGVFQMVEHVGTDTATTVFEWDQNSHQLSVQIQDPGQIVPANRQYQLQLVGEQLAQPATWQSLPETGSFHLETSQSLAENQLTATLVKQALQFANADFDLKNAIWQQFKAAEQPTEFLSFLSTLDQPDLAAMLTELVASH